MQEIVCATRGGQGSRAVRLRAIAQARTTGKPLAFFYAVDIGSVGAFDETLREAVREELFWQGRVMLEIARRQAESAGLKAAVVIREGSFLEELIRYLTEQQASLCLLGAPRGTTVSHFGDDAIERAAADIHDRTGVPVEIARPDETR